MAEHIATLVASQGTHDMASWKSFSRLMQRTIAFQSMRQKEDFAPGVLESSAG
jgi:hypothetical protein